MIDDIYDTARRAGAIGGKLLGAGGGGFMLFFARPDTHEQIKASLPGLLQVPFRFEGVGSQIVFYQQETPIVRDMSWADAAHPETTQASMPVGKVA